MIPQRYQLKEHTSQEYLRRAEQNVIDSEGTAILTIKPMLVGGSRRTAEFAGKHGKALLHIHPETPRPADKLREFVAELGIKVLNVAGPRASSQAGIEEFVLGVLRETFSK